MSLPKMESPTFNCDIPSTGEKVKLRPFTVKEEKILLIALEGSSENDVEENLIDAIKQILSNCITEEIDINTLSSFDIEYIFLQIRAASIGEIITLTYKNNKCNKGDDGGPCGIEIPVQVNLNDVKPTINKNHNKKIELTDTVGVIMKYPSITDMVTSYNLTESFDVVIKCIDMVYDENGTYSSDKYDFEELEEFVESLTKDQFQKIQNFFETMPEISHNINIVCNKCGLDETITLRGISDFFE